ncbi:MAG: hypothetical protein AAF799_33695 [Myxococcota bacterium]
MACRTPRCVARGWLTAASFVVVGSTTGCVEIDPSYANVPTTGESTSTGSQTSGSDSSGGSGDESTARGPVVEMNLAFVTSTAHNPSFGGLAAADAICNDRASEAGLPGSYVAYLSDSTADAVTRLGSANGWTRTDGRVFATDRQALTSGQISYPLMYTESGTLVNGNGVASAFTGSLRSGLVAPEHCENWQSTDGKVRGRGGYTDGGDRYWVDFVLFSCANTGHLLCLGIDADAPQPAPTPPADARRIFATAGLLTADAGRQAADDLCALEANAAGLEGTVLALMAEPGETLWERHALDGGDWVRADGVTVISTAGDPSQWLIAEAPVLFDATGTVTPSTAFWTGVDSPTSMATAETTCDGWTDTAYAARPFGSTVYAEWILPSASSDCSAEWSVVCLQQ